MLELARMAGFFAAHGIWSVAEGGPLIPLLGYEDAVGSRGMVRFVADRDIADATLSAQAALRENTRGHRRAVLVHDGYAHLPTGRTDALVVEAVDHGGAGHTLKVAVPYRPEPFAVHRPEFLAVGGGDRDGVAAAFFAGVDSHEPAAACWNAHVDESV
jgi:hypothetical protein